MITANPNKKYWENVNSGRYYIAYVGPDLLNDWTVTCIWGGKGKKPTKIKHLYAPSFEASITKLETIARCREKRGYTLLLT